MKICGKCKEEKPFGDFSRNKSRKDGLHYCCRQCKTKDQRAWYKGSSEKHKENVRVRKNRVKKEIIQKLYEYFLENPCKHCEETNPLVLEFDHLRDKEKNVSDLLRNGCSWESILEEIEKCQVLCANCHRKKTAKDQNWLMFRLYTGVKLDSELGAS